MKRLLSSGGWIDVNCVGGRYQDTPLIKATYRKVIDVVQVLLNSGAEVDKKNRDGYTALHVAAVWGYEEQT